MLKRSILVIFCVLLPIPNGRTLSPPAFTDPPCEVVYNNETGDVDVVTRVDTIRYFNNEERYHGQEQVIIVIGGSTGGYKALQTLLEGLPEDHPPIVCNEHWGIVAEQYPNTPLLFYRWITEEGKENIKLIDNVEEPYSIELKRGMVIVGAHNVVVGKDEHGNPVAMMHRGWRSVDDLFRSAAQNFGKNVICVTLSGYGHDGADGAQEVRENDGVLITQDIPPVETVLFRGGMPSAVRSKCSPDKDVVISKMPETVMECLSKIEKIKGPRNFGMAYRNRWAFVDLSMLIGQFVYICREQRIRDREKTLARLINKHIRNRDGMDEILLEGYDIDAVKEIREGNMTVGFSLPVRRKSGEDHYLQYRFDKGQERIPLGNGREIFVTAEPDYKGRAYSKHPLENAGLEIVKDVKRGGFKVAVFDWDGTLSLIRAEWPRILSSLIAEIIAGRLSPEDDPVEIIRDDTKSVRAYLKETAGAPTLDQIKGYLERNNHLEHLKDKDLDRLSRTWLDEYNRRLNRFVEEEVVPKAGDNPEDYRVAGALKFVKKFREQGIKCYVLSGGNEKDLNDTDVPLLGFDGLFELVLGTDGTIERELGSYDKGVGLEWIMKREGIEDPGEVVVIGDGAAEISFARKLGIPSVALIEEGDLIGRQLFLNTGANYVKEHGLEPYEELFDFFMGQSRGDTSYLENLIQDLWDNIDNKELAAIIERYLSSREDNDIKSLMLDDRYRQRVINILKDIARSSSHTMVDLLLLGPGHGEDILGGQATVDKIGNDLISLSHESLDERSFFSSDEFQAFYQRKYAEMEQAYISKRKGSDKSRGNNKWDMYDPDDVDHMARARKLFDEEIRPLEPVLDGFMNDILDDAGLSGDSKKSGNVLFTSIRTKSAESALEKAVRRRRRLNDDSVTIADIFDLVGGRIIVDDYMQLERLAGCIEDYFEDDGDGGMIGRGRMKGAVLISKVNKYVEYHNTPRSYRAVHYSISFPGTEYSFELQLMTMETLIAMQLEHDVVYKEDVLTLNRELRQTIINYCWRTTAESLKKYYFFKKGTVEGVEEAVLLEVLARGRAITGSRFLSPQYDEAVRDAIARRDFNGFYDLVLSKIDDKVITTKELWMRFYDWINAMVDEEETHIRKLFADQPEVVAGMIESTHNNGYWRNPNNKGRLESRDHPQVGWMLNRKAESILKQYTRRGWRAYCDRFDNFEWSNNKLSVWDLGLTELSEEQLEEFFSVCGPNGKDVNAPEIRAIIDGIVDMKTKFTDVQIKRIRDLEKLAPSQVEAELWALSKETSCARKDILYTEAVLNNKIMNLYHTSFRKMAAMSRHFRNTEARDNWIKAIHSNQFRAIASSAMLTEIGDYDVHGNPRDLSVIAVPGTAYTKREELIHYIWIMALQYNNEFAFDGTDRHGDRDKDETRIKDRRVSLPYADYIKDPAYQVHRKNDKNMDMAVLRELTRAHLTEVRTLISETSNPVIMARIIADRISMVAKYILHMVDDGKIARKISDLIRLKAEDDMRLLLGDSGEAADRLGRIKDDIGTKRKLSLYNCLFDPDMFVEAVGYINTLEGSVPAETLLDGYVYAARNRDTGEVIFAEIVDPVDKEKKQAEIFLDEISVMQAMPDSKISFIAVGTDWMRGYNRHRCLGRHPQADYISNLLRAIRQFCDEQGIKFIYGEDEDVAHCVTDDILAGQRDACGIVLTGEDMVSFIGEYLKESGLDEKGNVLIAGVNGKRLTIDSYIRLMEILSVTLNIFNNKIGTKDFVNELRILHPGLGLQYISDNRIYFEPEAAPMDYERLKSIYSLQTSA